MKTWAVAVGCIVLCHNFSKQLLYRKRSPSLVHILWYGSPTSHHFFGGRLTNLYDSFYSKDSLSSKSDPTIFWKMCIFDWLELEIYGSLIGWNRKPTIFIIQKEAAGKQAALSFHQLYRWNQQSTCLKLWYFLCLPGDIFWQNAGCADETRETQAFQRLPSAEVWLLRATLQSLSSMGFPVFVAPKVRIFCVFLSATFSHSLSLGWKKWYWRIGWFVWPLGLQPELGQRVYFGGRCKYTSMNWWQQYICYSWTWNNFR